MSRGGAGPSPDPVALPVSGLGATRQRGVTYAAPEELAPVVRDSWTDRVRDVLTRAAGLGGAAFPDGYNPRRLD